MIREALLGHELGRKTDLTGLLSTSRIETGSEEGTENAEENVYAGADRRKLRQIEVLIGQGKKVPLACREAGIVEQTFYRWRKEYGGLQIEQALKLKERQKENAQLRRAIADLTVEKQGLRY